MNKFELIGNLGCPVELRYTSAGTAVANFRLATNERYKTSKGEERNETEWHRIVAWGKLAEYCAENFEKGSFVKLTGKVKTRAWDDREGVKRYTTEVHVYKAAPMNKNVQEEKKQEEEVEVPF